MNLDVSSLSFAPECAETDISLRVLLVEHDLETRRILRGALGQVGHEVNAVADGFAALAALEREPYDLVVSDVASVGTGGTQLFREVREAFPAVAILLTCDRGALDDVVDAVKAGVEHHIARPVNPEHLLRQVRHLSRTIGLNRELRTDARGDAEAGPARNLIGRSAPMRGLKRHIERVAPSDASVVIQGESGTGKELVARAIHAGSARRHRPFVVINCAALPETLIEAELFGYERGAFTGATKRRAGRFEAAHGGTLFLDEVGEIPLSVQCKLLRVLQERRVERLGSLESVPIDVRILCATHRDLKAMIASGQFREDLYYRLNVLSIRVPTLRERVADLPLLVRHFWCKFSGEQAHPRITPRAWSALANHSYPGNVRELEHAVHHAAVLGGGAEIDLRHLPPDLRGGEESDASHGGGVRPLSQSVRDFERQCLLQALSAAGGRRKAAADMLAISRKTLWEKLKLHGITETDLHN